jgi:hypothetical protein
MAACGRKWWGKVEILLKTKIYGIFVIIETLKNVFFSEKKGHLVGFFFFFEASLVFIHYLKYNRDIFC